jgi:hypothetical protein
MSQSRRRRFLWLMIFLAAATVVQAQQSPRIGYLYPAGGRQGTVCEIEVGGQFLNGVDRVHVSGTGIQADVVEHVKPLTPKQINEYRQKLREIQKRMQAERRKAGNRGPQPGFKMFAKFAEELGVSAEELKRLRELREKLTDPKRQPNPQIAETVTLQVTLAEDAEPGERELRLITPSGVTNPLRFHVGDLPEYRENEPNDKMADTGTDHPLPLIINGQILPGDVDRFRFKASKGQQLVAAAGARELIPYLADAVPGWFQATLVLYDLAGTQIAYADDHHFHPDPVLLCEIPADGWYVLEIKDAIYRGREDFVYRIALGELPFVKSIFPLGGRAGSDAKIELEGWNLPAATMNVDTQEDGARVRAVSVESGRRILRPASFAVDTLAECLEEEPNDDRKSGQLVNAPVIVNGRIDHPGDWDVYRLEGRAGDSIVAEVQARRLNSPLDSLLELTDAAGRRLMVNDDHEDKGAGLTTHHADSRISATLSADGEYYLRLGDTQRKGGRAFGYRLRVSPARPDFELRVVPSSINARAGATVPFTVYALRRDGFAGDISLALQDAPPGFLLSGAWVPAGQDQVRLTLTVPPTPTDEPLSLRLAGRAVIDGRETKRLAVPADDMMQAFIYRHLVPAQDLLVAITGPRRFQARVKRLGDEPVKLPAGGTARVRFSMPTGPMVKQVQLTLNEPPEGIAVEKVSHEWGAAIIQLRMDAVKVKPGLKGNLIVDAFMERAVMGPGGKPRGNKRRIPLGTLPAIPFEVDDAD